jgi:hypothetical protein
MAGTLLTAGATTIVPAASAEEIMTVEMETKTKQKMIQQLQ